MTEAFDLPLFAHQTDMLGGIRNGFREVQSVLAQGACGIGKTMIATQAVKSASDKGNLVIFTVHRRELLEQTSNTFTKYGIEHSFISAGRHYNPRLRVQIATIGSLYNRIDKLAPPRLLIQDECHYSPSKTWNASLQWAKAAGTKILGLSATPIRSDGRGFEDQFDKMIQGPPVSWLIENGFLSDFKAYAPVTPDLSGVHIRAGEYAPEEVEKIMSGKVLVGNCVEHYKHFAYKKRTILYAVSVRHSEMLAAEFNAAGIPAAHLDANTPEHVRRQIILNFATGYIWVLTNCSLFAEGLDLSALAGRDVTIEAGIFASPTKSLSRHIQQTMRPMRKKSYPAVLIDVSGNFSRHGLPDHPHEWTLAGRPKSRRSGTTDSPDLTRKCSACDLLYPASALACTHCGAEAQAALGGGRTVDEIAGQLQEIDREQVRRERMREQSGAKSLEELIALGKAKGYKNPAGWAKIVFNARMQKQNRAG